MNGNSNLEAQKRKSPAVEVVVGNCFGCILMEDLTTTGHDGGGESQPHAPIFYWAMYLETQGFLWLNETLFLDASLQPSVSKIVIFSIL